MLHETRARKQKEICAAAGFVTLCQSCRHEPDHTELSWTGQAPCEDRLAASARPRWSMEQESKGINSIRDRLLGQTAHIWLRKARGCGFRPWTRIK